MIQTSKTESDDGQQIANRLVLHERSQGQLAFLRLLHNCELGKRFILRGSSALYGVHLHDKIDKRYWRVAFDLDFLTDRETYTAFEVNPAQWDLPLANQPTGDEKGEIAVYHYTGRLIPNVAVSVDVSVGTDTELMSNMEGTWTAVGGRDKVRVRVQSIEAIIRRKLWYVSFRTLPYDFVDLWLALPFLSKDVVLGNMEDIVLEAILNNLVQAEAEWKTLLAKTMIAVPPYSEVRNSLTRHLIEEESTA